MNTQPTIIGIPANFDEYREKYFPKLADAFNLTDNLQRIERVQRSKYECCVYAGMFQLTHADIKGYYFLDVSVQAYSTHVDVITDILDQHGNELHVMAVRYPHYVVLMETEHVASNTAALAVGHLKRALEVTYERTT